MNKFLRWAFRCGLFAAVIPALAHHSFAMFDSTKQVTLEGTVREIQWTNPHTWVQLVVMENGKSVEYSLEGQSPNGLIRMGWTKNMLKAGDKVKIVMSPLKDGSKGGSVISCTLPDGRVLGGYGEPRRDSAKQPSL
jgi:hypothetical protein